MKCFNARNISRIGLSAVFSFALVVGVNVSGASASIVGSDSNDDALRQLIEANPGISEDELLDSFEGYAQDQGISVDEAIAEALKESQRSLDAVREDNNNQDGALQSQSSGGGANISLGTGKKKGDVFYSPASTSGIKHGHSGIYYSPKTIVEAPGLGKRSRSILASNVDVSTGARKQTVKTTQVKRNAAANYAFGKLTDLSYNKNFAMNKNSTASSMNCSQLVWAAYKRATGIDLDGNGGLGVYPSDIRDSSKTHTYVIL